jgi:hypothetical protein
MPTPILAEPEDEMERMTEEQWRGFKAWAVPILLALLLVLAGMICGARCGG